MFVENLQETLMLSWLHMMTRVKSTILEHLKCRPSIFQEMSVNPSHIT